MKPLPSTFAVHCTNTGCWIATSRSERPFERRRLQLDGRGELMVAADDAPPLVPTRSPGRRRLDFTRRRG
jgi:hypothetical protein